MVAIFFNTTIDRGKGILVLECLMESQYCDLASEKVLSLLLKPSLWCPWAMKKIGWKSNESLLNLPPLGFAHHQEQAWISTATVMAIGIFLLESPLLQNKDISWIIMKH